MIRIWSVKLVSSILLLASGMHVFASAPAAHFHGCPIHINVTLTYLSTQPPTATRRGSNTWKVDWQMSAHLPGGVNADNVSYKITVSDQLGSHSKLVQGPTRTTTVTVEHTRSTPSTSLTPFATVEVVADSRRCDTELTFPTRGLSAAELVSRIPGGPNVQPPECSVPMNFTQNPVVVQLFKTLANGGRPPDGFAVKTDWNLGPLANCVTLKGFNLRIIVRFSDGSSRTLSETLSADARTRTIKVTDSPFAANRPVIQEVKLSAITEVKVFGSGRQ